MVQYQRNNIIFRIASSDAIAKFKTLQAHTLSQVARTDIAFDLAAREVVLLEYDRLSQWLYRMERILLAVGHGPMHETLRHAILESYKEEVLVIENVMDSHIEVFDSRVAKFAKTIHRYSFDLLHEEMEKRMHQSIDRAYGELTDVISAYLQHILICMHEYNNNFVTKKEPIFLAYSAYFSDLKLLIDKQNNSEPFALPLPLQPPLINPLVLRARFFLEHDVGDLFILKNYTEFNVEEAIATELGKFGINVVPSIIEDTISTD